MKSFFNRGTVIQTLDFETDDPLKTAQYYKLRGFKNGIDEYSVSLEENAPFSFRFIPKEVLKNIKPNEKA